LAGVLNPTPTIVGTSMSGVPAVGGINPSLGNILGSLIGTVKGLVGGAIGDINDANGSSSSPHVAHSEPEGDGDLSGLLDGLGGIIKRDDEMQPLRPDSTHTVDVTIMVTKYITVAPTVPSGFSTVERRS
jgi:hypothetical protein